MSTTCSELSDYLIQALVVSRRFALVVLPYMFNYYHCNYIRRLPTCGFVNGEPALQFAFILIFPQDDNHTLDTQAAVLQSYILYLSAAEQR